MRLSLLEVPRKLKIPIKTRIGRLPVFGSYKNNYIITNTYTNCEFITILLRFFLCHVQFFSDLVLVLEQKHPKGIACHC